MSVTSPLLDGLNDIQREAVLQTEGPVLIVAGAGSGKTRALTHRIAYLIRECGVSPGEILAITFTNKASREMAERVGELLGGPISRGMWVLTFHSTCARILRREHAHLGVPSNFTIYDDGDTERLISGISRDMNVDPKRYPAKAIASAIGKAKDRVLGAKEFSEMASSLYEETVAKIYVEYERRKRDAGALDFDDLISETVRLFRDHPEVLQHYQERFRYVLIDEYQDTNRAQYELVNMLAAKYRNICVVGDADQGVYSWRGATIQNILDFEHDYPDAAVYLMEQNYRSTQNILTVANALIENNIQRKPKNLWTEAGSGDKVVRVRANDEHSEAYFVAQEIERLRSEDGFRYRDVAIFYRTNAQSRVIEDVLMRVGMPYRVFGGVRFYQRKEIKDILAYLRLLTNPQDVISFRRVVNTPKRGIGDATVAAVEAFAREEGIEVMQACRRVDEIASLAARAKGAVAGFTSVMTAIAGHLADGAGPARMVEFAAQESGYLAELEEQRTVEAQGRIENIQELSGVAAELDRARPRRRARPVPGAGIPHRRAGRLRRGGVLGHPDDPPYREGSRVPRGVHRRTRGRDLPALPVDDGFRRARGGAPVALRGHHAGAEALVPLSRVGPNAVRADELQPAVAVPERAAGEPHGCPRGGWRIRPDPLRGSRPLPWRKGPQSRRRVLGRGTPRERHGGRALDGVESAAGRQAGGSRRVGRGYRRARAVGRRSRHHREGTRRRRGGDDRVLGRGREAAAPVVRAAQAGRLSVDQGSGNGSTRVPRPGSHAITVFGSAKEMKPADSTSIENAWKLGSSGAQSMRSFTASR